MMHFANAYQDSKSVGEVGGISWETATAVIKDSMPVLCCAYVLVHISVSKHGATVSGQWCNYVPGSLGVGSF